MAKNNGSILNASLHFSLGVWQVSFPQKGHMTFRYLNPHLQQWGPDLASPAELLLPGKVTQSVCQASLSARSLIAVVVLSSEMQVKGWTPCIVLVKFPKAYVCPYTWSVIALAQSLLFLPTQTFAPSFTPPPPKHIRERTGFGAKQG